ncbi:MAG: MSMEG_1061 family FMN-dependent PPOX-type flavoprotein [Microthrixaceae bacterium]
MPFEHTIEDRAQLRQHYAEPFPAVKSKQIDHVDEAARAVLARTPFVVVATSGAGGVDASPRGGPPGFVRVVDDRRVAIGDLSGNRRLDTFENLFDDPRIGLLCLIPGMSETMRINGRGSLTTDPAVLDLCTIDGARPGVALGVDVEEVFLHCAKALRRSGLWDPERWPDAEGRPTAGEIFKAHLGLDIDAALIDADLEQGYEVSMWEPGGHDEPTPDTPA